MSRELIRVPCYYGAEPHMWLRVVEGVAMSGDREIGLQLLRVNANKIDVAVGYVGLTLADADFVATALIKASR